MEVQMAGFSCSHRLRAALLLRRRWEESFQSYRPSRTAQPARKAAGADLWSLTPWASCQFTVPNPTPAASLLCSTPCTTTWFILPPPSSSSPSRKSQGYTKVERIVKWSPIYHKPTTQLQQLSIHGQSCFNFIPTYFHLHSSSLILLGWFWSKFQISFNL